MAASNLSTARCVTFQYPVPVCDPIFVEGETAYMAVAADGQPWPSWQFGY